MTARHGQPQRSHAPIILTFLGGVVSFEAILIFSHQCFRTITCLQCRRNILWSLICCKSQFNTAANGGLFAMACRINVFISNFSMELWKVALILLFSRLQLSYSPALCSTRVTDQGHKGLPLNGFHTGSNLLKLQGLIKLTLWWNVTYLTASIVHVAISRIFGYCTILGHSFLHLWPPLFEITCRFLHFRKGNPRTLLYRLCKYWVSQKACGGEGTVTFLFLYGNNRINLSNS